MLLKYAVKVYDDHGELRCLAPGGDYMAETFEELMGVRLDTPGLYIIEVEDAWAELQEHLSPNEDEDPIEEF